MKSVPVCTKGKGKVVPVLLLTKHRAMKADAGVKL